MSEASTNLLSSVYEKIKALAPFGANAVHRRALAVLADELQAVAGRTIFQSCPPERGNRGRTLREAAEADPFASTYYETRSDDRRRSVMLSQQENLAMQLIDFYTDRLDVFEIREPESLTADQFSASENLAKKYLKSFAPIVATNLLAAESPQEVIDALRALALVLERRLASGVQAQAPAPIGGLARESCGLWKTEVGGFVWVDNGTRLQQSVRDIFSCVDLDQCCQNKVWTKHGDWRWVDVWQDGNSSNPPPSKPPKFEPRRWDERCPVFFSPLPPAWLTSDWGWRTDSQGNLDFHAGTDIVVPPGTQVRSLTDGEIVHINRTSPDGAIGLIIRAGSDVYTYWHVVADDSWKIGDMVVAGITLGRVFDMPRHHLHLAYNQPPNGDWKLRSDANSAPAPCMR